MKVTVERAELLKSLGHVHRVVERRNTIPILANVLMRAEKSALNLKATDLDLEVIETIAAEVAPGGSTTVPAHMFYEIVRKLPEGSQVVLEASGDRAVMAIRAGRSRFTLQTLPESDFPDLAAGDMTHKFKIPANDLKRLLDKTQFAISTEETRYYLNGIYLHIAGSGKNATLRAVATDGHRLAQAELAVPAGANGMPGVIVPRKTVNEVQRLVEGSDAEVAIEVSSAKIRFTLGDVVLTSKLIDGTFPDYGRVIPSGNDKQLTVDKKDFEAAVDRVSTVSSERGRAVKLSLSSGRLVLSVTNPDSGQRDRGDRGRLRRRSDRYRLQLALPARHRGAARRRGRAAQAGRPRLADADRGQGRQGRALRADADAGVIPSSALHDRRSDPPSHAEQFPQLPRGEPRSRRQSCRAHRAERRRQDQSDRSDVLPDARPGLAPRHPRGGRLHRGRRRLGGCRRGRGHARPRHARHRHRAARTGGYAHAAANAGSTASRSPQRRPLPTICA